MPITGAVALVPRPDVPPRERARQLRDAWIQAHHAVTKVLTTETADWAPSSRTYLDRIRELEFLAAGRMLDYFEGRTSRLARQLRDALAAETVTDPSARQRILVAMDGPSAAIRDGALLTRTEGEFLSAYRRLDSGQQAAIRLIASSCASGLAVTGVDR